jgi:hypothetical protein
MVKFKKLFNTKKINTVSVNSLEFKLIEPKTPVRKVAPPPFIYKKNEVAYTNNLSGKAIPSSQTNELTSNIIRTLCSIGFMAHRLNNTGIPSKNGGLRVSHTMRGLPDIMAVQKQTTRALFIEVKSANDKHSDWQLYWHKIHQDAGIPVFTAWSFTDFKIKIALIFNIQIK